MSLTELTKTKWSHGFLNEKVPHTLQFESLCMGFTDSGCSYGAGTFSAFRVCDRVKPDVKINIKKVFAKDKLHIQACTYACGPSALLNVLALKGNYVHNEKELIKLCKAKSKVGTSHENLVKAAKSLGLNVIEEKKNASIKDIERNIDHHAYVIVNYLEAFDGEGHYSVITNYDKKSFYFMDSVLGQLRLKKKLFLRWWYNQNKTVYRWYISVN